MSEALHATKVYELETGRVYRYAGADCQGMKAAERFRSLENAPTGPRALDELAADGGDVVPLREFESGDLVWVQHVGFVSSLPVHDNAAEWRLCVVCCQMPVEPVEHWDSVDVVQQEAPSAQKLLALLFRQVRANGAMLDEVRSRVNSAMPGC